MCILDWPRYVKGCIHGKISEYMACIFLKLIGKHLVPYLWFKMIWFDYLMKRFQFDVVRISVWSGKDLCFFFTTGIIYVGLIEVIFYSELQMRLCCVEVELWFWQYWLYNVQLARIDTVYFETGTNTKGKRISSKKSLSKALDNSFHKIITQTS